MKLHVSSTSAPIGTPESAPADPLLRPLLRVGRWAILLALTSALFFGHAHLDEGHVRATLALTLLLYAPLSLLVLRTSSLSGMRGGILLGTDLVYTALLVEASGGIRSPFFGLYDLVVFAAAILYELRGGVVAVASVLAITAGGELLHLHGRDRPQIEMLMSTLPELVLSSLVAGYLSSQLQQEASRHRETERTALILDLERQAREREMAMAREVQEAALPASPPYTAGLEVAVRFRSANEVGGDFYDFYEQDGELGWLIGDVGGKGVPAALVATTGMHLFHTQAPSLGLARWCEAFNRELEERTPADMLATVLCCRIDGATGRGAWVNAGHPPPVLLSREGRLRLLEKHGLALGIAANASYSESSFELQPGDLLVCFTDGLTEAERPDGTLTGVEVLLALLPRLAERDAEAIAAAIEAHLLAVATVRDDLTLVVVRRL